MFVIGGVPGLILAPLMIRNLPESEVFLEQRAAAGPRDPAAAPAARTRSPALFSGLAWPAPRSRSGGPRSCGLILVYGLNTWLPKLMVTAGYRWTRGSVCC